MEQGVQEEQGVGGLGGHSGDPADVHMGSPGPVEEVQVQEHGLAVPGQPRGHPPLHLVEVQRLVAVLAPRAVGGQAR